MKSVLIVTTSYPETDDGQAAAGVFVRDFARALRQHVEVTVVAPGTKSGVREEGGLNVRRFAVPRLPLSQLSPANPLHWSTILRTLRGGERAVMESCADSQFDHILALWVLPSGHWAAQAGRRYGIPYSTWALGSDIWSLGRIPGVRRYLARILRVAARRFADGLRLAEDVTRIAGLSCSFLPSSRVFGRCPRLPSASPPYRLAFLGRWHPNKGIDLLLDALGRLDEEDRKRIEAVRIHGGGPLEQVVRTRAAMLTSGGLRVEVGGYLDLDGARDLFDWSDYVLIPSRIESIPVVFSDAMQAGRPVIAMPVGDLPELLSGPEPCGVLAQQVSAEGYAAAISEALHCRPGDFLAGVSAMRERFDVHRTAVAFLNETDGDAQR